MKFKFVIFCVTLAVSNKTHALEMIQGKVIYLEPSYMPGIVYFFMDTGNVTFPTNGFLKWQNKDLDNN